jgi:hypothetical protein
MGDRTKHPMVEGADQGPMASLGGGLAGEGFEGVECGSGHLRQATTPIKCRMGAAGSPTTCTRSPQRAGWHGMARRLCRRDP